MLARDLENKRKAGVSQPEISKATETFKGLPFIGCSEVGQQTLHSRRRNDDRRGDAMMTPPLLVGWRAAGN